MDMEAAHQYRTAAAVRDLDRALATLGKYQSQCHGRRLDTAYLTIESAKELLCDERQSRAVQLLQHARKVLRPAMDAEEMAAENSMRVTGYVDSALSSLGL